MRVLALISAFALVGVAQAETPPASTAPVPKGVYTIDKPHTSLLFRVRHMGFSNFTGRFTRIDVRLETDPANLANSRLEVTIDPTSISSDNAPDGFLATLAGKGFLDSADFPQMKYRSTSVEVVKPNTLRVHGEFTLHGVTRPLELEAKYNGGYAGQPMDPHARIGFSAHGQFKRSDFGVSAGIPAPGMTMGVGDEVEIVIETELTGPPLAK